MSFGPYKKLAKLPDSGSNDASRARQAGHEGAHPWRRATYCMRPPADMACDKRAHGRQHRSIVCTATLANNLSIRCIEAALPLWNVRKGGSAGAERF